MIHIKQHIYIVVFTFSILDDNMNKFVGAVFLLVSFFSSALGGEAVVDVMGVSLSNFPLLNTDNLLPSDAERITHGKL